MNRRPVTLFTGQWADLPLEPSWPPSAARGASTGSSSPAGATTSTSPRRSPTPATPPRQRELLAGHGLRRAGRSATTSSARRSPTRSTPATRRCCRPRCGATASPPACRQRAAERMKDTARAAAQLGVDVVTGFTGSPVWHMLYSFPPNDFDEIERGYETFAEQWGPIIDVFEAEGVRFALEVHPTEIAYDFVTTRKTLAAIGDRPGFGINFDPSHLEHQFLDSAAFIEEFGARILHAHVKDSKRRLDGRSSILGGHLDFGRPGAAGTSSPPATATSTSRRCSARSTASATRARCRSSGRTRAWTATGARPTRSRSCAAPTSRRRRWPSTRPSRANDRADARRSSARSRSSPGPRCSPRRSSPRSRSASRGRRRRCG